MTRHVDREEIESALNTLATLYRQHKEILNKDDRYALCHAHSVIEGLAKTYSHRQTKEYAVVDIDVKEFGVISSVAEQNAYWGNGSDNVDLT